MEQVFMYIILFVVISALIIVVCNQNSKIRALENRIKSSSIYNTILSKRIDELEESISCMGKDYLDTKSLVDRKITKGKIRTPHKKGATRWNVLR